MQLCNHGLLINWLFSGWVMSSSWTSALQASLISPGLLRSMCIESVMLSNHLMLCCPLLLLPSIFPSIRVFSNESALCIRWLKCWSFSFSISPSNEYLGLISFRIDWFHLLVVLGTLKSLLQHHSLNTYVFWARWTECSVLLSFELGVPLTHSSHEKKWRSM